MEKELNKSPAKESLLLRARHHVHDLLHASELESKGQHVVRLSITIIIVLSILAVILQSEQTLEDNYGHVFYIVEIITVIFFSTEYLLRLWSIVDDEDGKYSRPILGRLRYIFTPLALVDLFSVLPFYLPLLLPFDLRFIRMLRLIRLVRVLKLGHYSRSLSMLTRVLKAKKAEMAASFFIVFLLLIFSSTVIYYLEHDAQPDKFRSIPASLWWGVITLTTVGYGDMAPVTVLGKVFAGLIAFCGVGVFAIPSAIFVSGLLEEIRHVNELIICSRCLEEIGRKEKVVNGQIVETPKS